MLAGDPPVSWLAQDALDLMRVCLCLKRRPCSYELSLLMSGSRYPFQASASPRF
jgi:hypothetical protein